MAENKIQNSIQAVRKGLKEILSDMEVIDKKIIETAANAKKIGTGFKANTPDGLTQILKQQNDLLQKMNGLLDKQNTNTKKLKTSRRTLKQLSADEVVNQRKLAKNADLQAQSTSKLVGAYDRLNAKYRQSKQRLNDLNASHSASRKEIAAATREYRKYQARLNQVNRATSNFSKNSLGGMVRGFRNLLGAFGIVGGLTAVASFAKSTFNLTKRLQSLDFALKTVTKTTVDYAEAMEFVDDLTFRYGLDLESTTTRFTKFLAAAQQSNITFKETSGIFESMSKAASVLGLRTDELNGVYLALEQMLSKGKVTTEELRRQLGERLPGAMGIMAASIGVTIPELDKMLKKGEVLSAEVLPKFAETVEKAYGIENVNRVDTLVAAQNRLSSSYTKMIREITQSSDGSGGILVSIFNAISSQIERFRKGVLALRNSFSNFKVAIKTVYDNLRVLFTALGLTGDNIKTLGGIISRFLKILTIPGITSFSLALEKLGEVSVGVSSAMKTLFERLSDISLLDLSNPITAIEKLSNAFRGLGESFNEGVQNYKRNLEIQKQIKLEQQRQEVIGKTAEVMVILDKINGGSLTVEEARNKIADESIETLQKMYDEILMQIRAKEELNEEEGKGIKALKGSVAWLEQEIKLLEEKRQKLATNGEEYAKFSDQITENINKLKELQAQFDLAAASGRPVEIPIEFRINELDSNQSILDMFGIGQEALESEFDGISESSKNTMDEFSENWENTMDSAEAYAKLKLDTVKGIFSGVFDTFSEAFDFDFSSTDFIFESLMDKEKELFSKDNIDEWANFSKEAINSVLDASLNKYQVELQEAQRARDLIVQNELATEKEKRLARQKFEEEERRIKTEQAKAERKNTLIKIATDTAVGIVSALAQIPKFDFGISATAFAAFIAASGAAQAALVASQPIPKFAEGTKSPLADDTLAWVGDGGRREAITKNGKLLDVTPDSPTLAMLPKGAEVHKDASEWINNSIYRMNMVANGELLGSMDSDYILHDELRKMRQDSKRTWEEVKKLANRPLNVRNKVIIEKETEYRQ